MKQSVSAEQIELKSSLPGSKKVYVDGPREGMKVPMREIEQSDTNGVPNPPIRVYDTSGPYTDPEYKVELEKGVAGAAPLLDSRARGCRSIRRARSETRG